MLEKTNRINKNGQSRHIGHKNGQSRDIGHKNGQSRDIGHKNGQSRDIGHIEYTRYRMKTNNIKNTN